MNVHDVGGRRRFEDSEFTLRIYPGTIAEGTIYCPVSARKSTTAAEVIDHLINKLQLDKTKCYVLAEVKEFGGEEWILNPTDCPVQRMMLWPRMALENRFSGEDYRFLLREKNLDGSIHYGNLQMWLRVTEERRRMVERGFLPQPQQKDYDDLCNLPDLNEKTLLDNLRSRFKQEKIYTYVGSILIVINPFKFLPIYNPKYVKMYDNHQLGKLEPHIYAVADVAYHAMLQQRNNQCIVISGESGSGKTQSTNFLIHHLTALSQKGFASGVEQIILGAGPVLEAFGNAKTAHNNNSSRFGKFIQVNYHETGTVRGAYVEKYLLEKSRLVYQEHNERNYHVFYYLLAGASEEERTAFHLKQPEEYHYLNQMTKKPLRLHWENYYESELQDCFTVEGEDLKHDFERLQLAMEMVGFLPATRKQIFSLLSAILHLGNIRYKKKTYRDDSIDICNPEALPVVSKLLEVKEEMLFDALTTRKTMTVGERLIVPYRLSEAVTVRDSMAKSLYSALFDWIVFRINHALLNTRDLEENTKILSIGVLDIFGFEDYENNSFEQFCINFANERLQHYFNQHIFNLEQEEYRSEGISWRNIDYIDNTGCINLISKKPTALFHLLDEECNFPQASNQTLLDKFKRQHEGNSYIEFPAVMEPAFIIRHYAGKVKYGVKDFREKNTDHMRPDIIALLKSSKNSFICGLIGIDPVATFRWAVLRSYFRAVVGFREAGKRYAEKKTGHDDAVPCAVLKSVDSFSFLHHPVHQRSLEILQRCKEEKYSITRKSPRTPLSDLQGANTINEKTQRDSLSLGWNGRSVRQGRLSSSGSLLEEDGIFMNSTSSKLLERAHGILMRNKHFKLKPSLPKHLLDVKSLKYLTSLTLQDRITKSLLHLHKKKKTPSISAQFQASLNKLMETLGQAEPYFVKCIRSNAEKLPLRFSDTLVLRQLRYTGMLETVRIRQSGYSIKYTFQDFVDHFHVLLPDGTGASQHSIREYLSQVDLNPDSFQVGNTMVFMREVERQRLQDLLHQEVLRRIIVLQRWFRTLLERKHFLSMKQAATAIQRWWRSYRMKQARAEAEADPVLLHGAATSIQSSWRGYRERRRVLQMQKAAFIIQRSWREHCYQRGEAAVCIQAAWRGCRERRVYRTQRRRIILLQAACRGYLARQRFRDLKEQKVTERQLENGQTSPTEEDEETFGNKDIPEIMGVDPTKWEDCSYKDRETFLSRLSSTQECNQEEMSRDSRSDSLDRTVDDDKGGEGYTGVVQEVVVRERPKSLDDPKQKKVVRAKRESRRMRELEQAKFSLELLKVRSTGGVSPSEERRWSTELISPQGTPDSESSRGSFELLSIDDYPKVKPASAESEESGSPSGLLEHQDILSSSPALPDSLQTESEILDSEPLSTSPSGLTPIPKIENSLPIFYVPHSKSSTVAHRTSEDSTAASKPAKERRDSVRKPVVVVISMQKDTVLDDISLVQQPPQMRDSESQTIDLPAMPREVGSSSSVPGGVNSAVLEKLEKLNVEKAERQKQQQQQNEKEMMDQIRQQKEILGNQRKVFEQNERDMFEKQRGEALQKIEQSRRSGPTQPIATSSKSVERPQSLLITQGPWEPGTPRGVSPSAVDIQIIPTTDTGDKESLRLPAKERPISMFLERRDGLRRAPQDLDKMDRWTPKLNLETRDGAARNERIRQPKVPSPSRDSTATDRPTPIFFLPKDNRVAFTKFEKESATQEKDSVRRKEGPASTKLVKVTGHKGREVARPAHKKKARMARTRSDFLTRGTNPEGEGESEEDEYDDTPISPPLSPSLPRPQPEPLVRSGQACHSDSEMPASQTEDQNMIHKTMSSGDLGKMDSMRKNAHTDGRVRGKMRFWGKTKQGDKKLSREKLASQAEQQELQREQEGLDTGLHMGDGPERQMTPPHSPDLAAERGKEFKENKEPSPKVRRRKSIKISSVALEQAQWQNDSLQILTSAGDYKCMNEFLQKKITDLDTEDSKKDTLVDVVFKKALKEFRLNIFNSYSTALAMDDGKSIRYKDLYALFEQILEKTMRQEQRDWSESPVKVWVNTFKVFLDEFMTEYKTLDSTVGKAPKPERKKRRKKDSDIVEEHNGHIFKSTQYSIPTYCEYCSSLIWMMDKACVCKLCRFACHRKCCLKTTTRCSKKYDPELSSRQFGVEVSRLTNDERTVPLVVEKLINYIEMHGLYTEGIYRKSGSTNKIKELKLGLDTDVNSMNLDDYNIHVIASVFKQWLRDLPNPVMTFELYEEFLRAMGLQEKKEIIRGVYSVIDQLPRTHLNTLERLIFHLVRIALQEDTNRMSSNALAIVFAPCILRCPDTIDPLQSVQDIGKTTACVELICVEQMNKYIARLKDINSLEFAENKAKSRLTLVRRSMPNNTRKGKGRLRRSSYHTPSSPVGTRLPSVSDVPEESAGEEAGVEVELSEQQQVAMQQEERVLTEQIESLQKEKEELTFEMLALEPRASDDETLESEASIGTADSSENLNMDSEGAASDMSERSSVWAAARHKQPESSRKTRRQLRKQTDSMDSVDSTSTVSSVSSTSHMHQGMGQRFRFRSKSPSTAFYRASPPRDTTEPRPEQGADERPQFTSRGTFSPEKGKQKLKTIKNSPQKPREPPDSAGGRKRNPEPDFGSPQQLVVYGSNEFMV
ncbi:unconventional myosin-IXAa-like isoform X3 [Acipenser ruthenus]|uniref:unconventional myosin-IXAa-like isoform X3 n=1 Tax=Acipenser ruthenus TaxID=7906 RepID=UPI0027405C8F|nr:unconventional myosin-IXAa-like isoform X3 [Acipenser ruthenus]